MDRGPLHDSKSPNLHPGAALPGEPPTALPVDPAPGAARDDDLARRRMELRVYRFLIALYPQLR